jgi:hypothetical protein
VLKTGQVITWINRGKVKRGIIRAIVKPGENLLEKCPEVRFASFSRSQFQAVSQVSRVLVEEPRDGRGGRHYSKFYAPLLSVVEKNTRGGEQIGNQS